MQDRLKDLRKNNTITQLRKEIKEAKNIKEEMKKAEQDLISMSDFMDALISVGELA